MTNYPWPMDKPIEEIAGDINCSYEEAIRYLLDRLKIAEAERDAFRRQNTSDLEALLRMKKILEN